MSSRKRVEEEEEEEEEDSEPVVILKGRKSSIKIVSDADQQISTQTTQQKFESSTSTSVQQVQDFSQPLSIAIQNSAQSVGSPKGQVIAQNSPKLPAGFGSPKGQVQQSPATVSPAASKQQPAAATISPVGQVNSPVQQANRQQASPKQTTAAPQAKIVTPTGHQQQAALVSPPQGQISHPSPVAQSRQQVQQQPQQLTPKPSAISPNQQQTTPIWSSQTSPNPEEAHPVLKQVPLKPAAPLVMPEQIVLHPAPIYDGALQKPHTEIINDESWRHAGENALLGKPERQPSRLGQVWPPAADQAQLDASQVPAVPVQAPESWVHQESVSALHAIAAAPWARKQVGRIGAQWPPVESEIQPEEIPFQRNLRPQWPPVADDVSTPCQVYQKIAMSHVHTQVAKQQQYFNSGGTVKNGEEFIPEPVQPSQVVQPQPVATKPGPTLQKAQQAQRPGQPVQHQQPQQNPPQVAQPSVGKSVPSAQQQRGRQQVQQQVAPEQPKPVAPANQQQSQQKRSGVTKQQQQQVPVQPAPQQQTVVSQQSIGAHQNGFSKQPAFRPKFVR